MVWSASRDQRAAPQLQPRSHQSYPRTSRWLAAAGAVLSYAPQPPLCASVVPEPGPTRPTSSSDWGLEPNTSQEPTESASRPSAQPAGVPKRSTPMAPETATRHLANAWHHVTGSPASEQTLSVLWAQWALETGRGQRMVGFNFAGLKGEGPDGISVLWWTREESPTGQSRVLCRFRAYATPEDGARDYVRVLRERFRAALAAAKHGDVKGFVQALARRGYFTDDAATYERSLSSLAREFMRQRLATEPPA